MARCAFAQQVIQVPGDFQTLQGAIDHAENGDTINIAPGIYSESIRFSGRAITVQGSAPGVVLKAPSPGPVVTFNAGESRGAVLQNLTLLGGSSVGAPSAGGILIVNASPTIQNVAIRDGQGCGILAFNAAPALLNNTVSGFTIKQTDPGCLPDLSGYLPVGGGIVVYGLPPGGLQAELTGNVVANNQSVFSAGGILILSAGRPNLRNNVIRNNTGNGLGAGLTVSGNTAPQIVQNLIYGNVLNPILAAPAYADVGAGIQLDLQSQPPSTIPITVTNNTVVANTLLTVPGARSQGSQVFVIGQLQQVQFSNNLIVGSSAQSVIDCSTSSSSAGEPKFDHNDIMTTTGAGHIYSGACTDQTGMNGNLSVAPGFSTDPTNARPYELSLSSAAVDAGDNGAPNLPSTDLVGQPRIQDAKGSGAATIDLGVYEFPGRAGPPARNDFGLAVSPAQLQIEAGHKGSATVTLTPLAGSVGTIQLSCSGLPAGSQCSFSPTQVQLSQGPATPTVIFSIGTAAALLRPHQNLSGVAPLFALAWIVPFSVGRRRKAVFGLGLVLLCVAGLVTTSCTDIRVPYAAGGSGLKVSITAYSAATGVSHQSTVMIDEIP